MYMTHYDFVLPWYWIVYNHKSPHPLKRCYTTSMNKTNSPLTFHQFTNYPHPTIWGECPPQSPLIHLTPKKDILYLRDIPAKVKKLEQNFIRQCADKPLSVQTHIFMKTKIKNNLQKCKYQNSVKPTIHTKQTHQRSNGLKFQGYYCKMTS